MLYAIRPLRGGWFAITHLASGYIAEVTRSRTKANDLLARYNANT